MAKLNFDDRVNVLIVCNYPIFIMINTDSPINPDILKRQQTLVAFVEALSRIFKVGIYYPEGHAILDKGASTCIYHLRIISQSQRLVRIEVAPNSLLIEETKLPENLMVVKEFHQLFVKLGIRAIELDKTISSRQLLFFVKQLLAWRMQLESAQTLITFNVAKLPNGIRVEQQEFLIDEATILHDDSDNAYSKKLDDLCNALSKQGLNTDQVEQCRGLLELLQSSSIDESKDFKGLPNATWEDVQNLLYKVVTGSYASDGRGLDPSVATDINVISSIFESLEMSLIGQKYKDTIRFLIGHLAGRRLELSPVEKKPKDQQENTDHILEEDQKISIAEFKKFIYENRIPSKILEKIVIVDNSERLSILLQLISPNQNKKLTEHLVQELRAGLFNRLTEREKKVLIEGIKQFADTKNFAIFRLLLNKVLKTLRESEENDSLDFIVNLWAQMPSSLHVLLWPFVVNELLIVGKTEKGNNFFEATEIASHMHSEGMKRLSPQLEELESFQKKEIADTIFDPSYTFSYRLFAFLLESSLGNMIAEKVLYALQENPQDTLFESIGPMLEFATPSHVRFVHSYLSQAHLKTPPLVLKMEAGKIIIEYLETIAEENKELPWLGKAIIAAAELQIKAIEPVLIKITKEKKMGILPAWPKNCRTAAETALRKLKQKSLTKLL